MVPPASDPPPAIDADAMAEAAAAAVEVLKVLSNPARLLLLCELLGGERSVSELEAALGASQSYVSGQLARMRAEGLVATTRDGRVIRYRLDDPRLEPILTVLYDTFCAPDAPGRG
ncbi:ArsR/SmtB family transcription factor [Pseudoroseicyclus sp. CXY001]|uniref:ArsR/SmtB family transcription factor n=1 Tax=Pseudoroseicyclus sp. CXY001 TaxID=3242492 RepID=UPI0035715273